MRNHDLTIKFISESDADAANAARDFSSAANEKGIDSEIIGSSETQDAGVIVGIILGSAAIVEIARGIADFVRRYNVSDVEVVGRHKSVRISDVNHKDLVELVARLSKTID